MNSRIKISLLMILVSMVTVGCAQRSYVMSFSESQAMTTSSTSRFGTHAIVQDRKQIPDKVNAAAESDGGSSNGTGNSAAGNSASRTSSRTPERAADQKSRTSNNATTAASGSGSSSKNEDYSGVVTANQADDATAVEESNANAASAYNHSFSGNETDHVRVTTYDPFAGSNTSFSIDLDAEAKNFTYPINGKFSSPYGRRGRGNHAGVDLVAPAKTPIYAAFDGTVRLSKPYSGYGNVIVIRHNNGLETVYAHNSKNLVSVGQTVRSGEQIALCGRTGRATTEHLHFEVRVKGQTINPALLIDVNQKQIQSGVLTIGRTPSGTITAKRSGDNASNQEAQYAAAPAPAVNTTISSTTSTSTSSSSSTTDAVTSKNDSQTITTAPIDPAVQSKGIRVGDTIYDAPVATPQTTTSKSAQKSTSSSDAKYHTIVSGDSLSRIAQKYGTTVSKLCALNNIDKNMVIKTGKKLRVK